MSIEKFIKSSQSDVFIKNGVELVGSIYNNSSKPKTKWDELINWQTTWRNKLKNGFQIFFDDPPRNSSMVTKRNFNKLKLVYKKKFQNFNSIVSPVMTDSVQLVITSNLDQMSPTVSAMLVTLNDLKVWDFNKVSKFFERLEINTKKLVDLENDQIDEKSNDIDYFNNNPHIYLYDIMQNYRPIILKVWEQRILNNLKKSDLPYPIILESTNYGKCPFDRKRNHLENSSYSIKKRYFRDELNRQYAKSLKKLYCFHSIPKNDLEFNEDDIIKYQFNNSTKNFEKQERLKLKRSNTNFKFMSFSESDRNSNESLTLTNELVHLHDLTTSTTNKYEDENNDIHDDGNNSDTTQETLATELNSTDNNIFVLGDYEVGTDMVSDIPSSGYSTKQDNKFKYCEICHEQFESLNKHCNSNTHKLSFQNNETNFNIIDDLIYRIYQRLNN